MTDMLLDFPARKNARNVNITFQQQYQAKKKKKEL